MTTKYITYLTDTLNGVPVQTQAAARNVSGSSQSSILKTAMKNLLQQKAVRSNKANYDVIAHDRKVQHLNRHRQFWQQALDDYLDSRQPKPQANINLNTEHPKLVQQPDGILLRRYRNGLIYEGNKVVGRYKSTKSLAEYDINFSFKSIDELLNFVGDDRFNVSPVDAVKLAVKTVITEYYFES